MCQIEHIYTEGYRSGHNEVLLKSIWAQARVGSNPTPSATTPIRLCQPTSVPHWSLPKQKESVLCHSSMGIYVVCWMFKVIG